MMRDSRNSSRYLSINERPSHDGVILEHQKVYLREQWIDERHNIIVEPLACCVQARFEKAPLVRIDVGQNV